MAPSWKAFLRTGCSIVVGCMLGCSLVPGPAAELPLSESAGIATTAWADAPDESSGSGAAGAAGEGGSAASGAASQGGASSSSGSAASGSSLRQTASGSGSSAGASDGSAASGSSSSAAAATSSSSASSASSSSQSGGDRGYVGPWYALNKTYVVDVEERFDSTAEEQYLTSAAQTGLIIAAAVAAFLAVLSFLRAHRVKKRASKGRR